MSLLWITAAYLDGTEDGPFFHASPYRFKEGQDVVPRNKRRNGPGWEDEHPPEHEWRSNRVWLTTSPHTAHSWFDHDPSVRVYQVQPIGLRKHQPTDYDSSEFPKTERDQYQARGARVIKQVAHDPDDCEDCWDDRNQGSGWD